MAGRPLLLLLLLLQIAACKKVTSSGLRRPSDPQPVKTYEVDLTLSPGLRWNKVLADHRQYLPAVQDMIRNYVPEEVLPLVEQIAEDIENLLPSPFAQEIIGGAAYWGVNVGDMILLNIVYDVSAFCTSIVAQDSNGTIWHVRNLDYSNTDLLRNLTVAVNFRRGNETVYSAVTYAGYVGILTGQRPNGFTITVNQRGDENKKLHPWWENELTAILDKSASFTSFLIRQTLEDGKDFNDAVHKLSTVVVLAPSYIIVGGANKGEGVVITRDRVAALDRHNLDPLQGRWYVLETNYDWWLPAPPGDSQRRAVGHREIDKLGAGHVNASTLYNVLSTPPVLNNATTYTAVMSASQPEVFKAFIRWPSL